MPCSLVGASDFTHLVFSWRTTLSATLFNNTPRLRLPSLQADLASTLVTYAMALSNFSHSVTASLGAYEFERAISEKERKEKDDKLNFGVTLLCRASGVFSVLSEKVLDDLNQDWSGGAVKPPDLCKEVNAALAKSAFPPIRLRHCLILVVTGWHSRMHNRSPFESFSRRRHSRTFFLLGHLSPSHTLPPRC